MVLSVRPNSAQATRAKREHRGISGEEIIIFAAQVDDHSGCHYEGDGQKEYRLESLYEARRNDTSDPKRGQ